MTWLKMGHMCDLDPMTIVIQTLRQYNGLPDAVFRELSYGMGDGLCWYAWSFYDRLFNVTGVPVTRRHLGYIPRKRWSSVMIVQIQLSGHLSGPARQTLSVLQKFDRA